jgi:hypothetical protein
MRFSPRTHIADVQLVVTRRTYAPEPGHTVTVWQENPIFTKHLIVHVFLDLGLLSGIMTNRRFSTNLENPDLSEFSETRIDPGEF